MPGPRKLWLEVRLALSKEDLKMKGIASLSVIPLSRSAVSMIKVSLSITQGPAMRNRGWSTPTL